MLIDYLFGLATGIAFVTAIAVWMKIKRPPTITIYPPLDWDAAFEQEHWVRAELRESAESN